MRIFRIQQFRAIALVASLLLLPVGGIAQEQQAFVINLRNAEISIFAEQVSQITGRTLVLHPTLSGDVTILSSEPIDQDGVWALFQSILRSRGFITINNDAVWQVVPISEARTKAPGNGEEASGT